MNLDELLGPGASRKFQEAVNVKGQDNAVVFYTEHEEKTPPLMALKDDNVIWLEADKNSWPGPGLWIKATVIWPDNISQQLFFQGKTICWGGGLCQESGGETGDSLKRLASQEMKQFLATYIDHMKVQLPNVPVFYSRFLLAGFEIESETDSQVIIAATLKDPNSKMAELFNWRINGTIPEEEPAWRTQVRADMGLEKLFPND